MSDVREQTLLPERIIVVDGDPSSGDVKRVVREESARKSETPKFIYIPSNHANLPFQRYLAWLAASTSGCDYLLYLDDDIRFKDKNVFEKLVRILVEHPEASGVTSTIRFGEEGRILEHEILKDQRQGESRGQKRKVFFRRKPGSLTPMGHRLLPRDNGSGLSEVEWLRGAVMLYSLKAMSEDVFCEDLFAVTEINCGLGEDTLLSRRVSKGGPLLFAHQISVDHPDQDLPKAYPTDPFRLGFAVSYSRRLLNDHYRILMPPRFSDRVFLLASYAWNVFLNGVRFLRHPGKPRWAYFRGYLLGALKGLFVTPLSSRLLPEIDWYQDARAALKKAVEVDGAAVDQPIWRQ